MKKTILLFGVFLASFAFAQVSIAPKATTSVPQPDPQATLDVRAMNAGTPDGILIPRLARTKAEAMTSVVESTMIYIDAIDGTAGTKTADVDAKGFYYYNGTKWVKVGAGPAKTIREVSHITIAEWANNQYALAQTSNKAIQLPDPETNKDRIIGVNNQYQNSISYAQTHSPANTSTLDSGKGHILISNGTKWYIIGGSY